LFEQIYRAVTIMVNHPYHRAWVASPGWSRIL